MNLTFLSSRLPLTKTFALTRGVMAATPYPHVARVTSHHEQAKDLKEFHELLVAHARAGHCLFGGQLSRPLKGESRAGLTDRQPKEWICFDFDKVEATDHEDVVARYLPAACQNVSYVVQLSASMFRPDTTTWSGHIFMLLDQPATEQYLKQWLEWLNFNVPELTGQISLSDSEQALHWPLDRTIAYDSKLIFIAPPKCHGFVPAIKESILHIKKRRPRLKIPEFTPLTGDDVKAKINELRRAVGLPDIAYTTTKFGEDFVLDGSDELLVHDIKTSGEHYIRFNINGGDSYAYFIDLRKPDLIRNFKGEPFLRTEEAAPDLWKSLRKAAPRAVAKQPLAEGTEVLAFYATNRNSQVKIGTYDHGTNELILNNSSETAAKAWLFDYGVPPLGLLPHKDLVFDPTVNVQYVCDSTQINTFEATEYMQHEKSSDKASQLADVPRLIDKVLRSMMGDPTDEVYRHFLNWLAYIYQERKKTGTAWVFSGTEGTGKGTFIKYVLTPIFGNSAVKTVQFGLLNQEYNDFLEQALFVVFEEADVNAVENQASLAAKLKHWITDDPITIRRMRTDPYPAPSYANFIFNSNKLTPVQAPGADRRFNFAERQTQRLFFTPNEFKLLQAGAELDGFVDVLARWPVDELLVTQLIETKAKQDVHESTTTINQLIAEAIQAGNLQFFLDRMPSDAEAVADFHQRFSPLGLFKAMVDRFIEDAHDGVTSLVQDEDLFLLFRTLIPDTRYFQDSKTWRMRHYKSLGLPVDQRVPDPEDPKKRVRGLLVDWQVPHAVPPAKAPAKSASISSINKKRAKA